MSQSAASNSETRTIGKYRLLRKLGEGGMGVVYEAEDPLMKRRVALKLLAPAVSKSPEALERFLREAQSAGKIFHPNIVAALDVGEQAGGYYFVMELIVGSSTAEHIRAHGAFDWPTATRIVADVCRGLEAAHKAGLIHRDIKPANIMQTADGVVKLADFGLAKATDGVEHNLTQTGAIVGTPSYMSPEQCSEAPLDGRSDLYSLGATYYTLLTGAPPFSRGGTPQLMFAHCNAAVPDPRDARPEIPAAAVAVVHRAMAKQPSDRYPSAREMLAALEAVLAGQPMQLPTAGADRAGPVNDAATEDLSVAVEAAKSRSLGLSSSSTSSTLTVTAEAAPAGSAGLAPAADRVPLGLLAGVAGLLVVCVLAGLALLSSGGVDGTDQPPVSDAAAKQADAKQADAKQADAKQADAKQADAKQTVTDSASKPPTVASTGTKTADAVKVPLPPVEPKTKPEPMSQTPPETKPSATTVEVDLLAATDPVADRVTTKASGFGKNQWLRGPDGSLEYVSDSKWGKVAAPVAIRSGHFEIELDYERTTGTGRLHLDIPLGNGKILPLFLDTPGQGVVFGMGPKWPSSNRARRKVLLTVRRGSNGQPDQVTLRVDEGPPLEWTGQLAARAKPIEPLADFPNEPVTSVFSMSSGYRLHAWRLRLLDGTAEALRRDKP